MTLKYERMKVFLGLVLALALISLACGVTDRAKTLLSGDSAEATSCPTRTPWPTFTPTPENVAVVPISGSDEQDTTAPSDPQAPVATIPPTDTPVPLPPTDTPVPSPPPPTATPPPPPTNTPAPPPPPTATPAPPPPAQPDCQSQYAFCPDAWHISPNAAIIHIKGNIHDVNGNPVNGFSVKVSNGSFTRLSYPSGPSSAAPDKGAGDYDFILQIENAGTWTLQVVRYECPEFFNPECNQYTPLSEEKVVQIIPPDESVVNANWVCYRECDTGAIR